LCGLSLGGYVALAFAHEYSRKLRALVLCDTRADADSDETRARRNNNIAFLETHSNDDFIERMIPNLLGETTRRDKVSIAEDVRVLAAPQKEKSCRDALVALRDRPDRSAELAQISAATLIVVGSEDSLASPEVARAMAAAIPNARCEILRGAGHLSNLEESELFAAVLQDFLRAL
jgi:3-oxoadipate enol-lactonase